MKDNMLVHMPAQFFGLKLASNMNFLASKWEFVMIYAQNK